MTYRELTDMYDVHDSFVMPTLVCCARDNSLPKVDEERRARVPRCWLHRYCANGTGYAQPVGEVGGGGAPWGRPPAAA